jgi:aryl-alcohol dehydrogenase-like predicted oxidoreductase
VLKQIDDSLGRLQLDHVGWSSSQTTTSNACSARGRWRTASGSPMAQLALALILHEPSVASAIVGASRPEQLRDNAAASGVELDDGTLRAVEAM